MGSGLAAIAGRAEISTVIFSLPRRCIDPLLAGLALTCTRPVSISSCTRVRLSSGHSTATKRSRRIPALAGVAENSRTTRAESEFTREILAVQVQSRVAVMTVREAQVRQLEWWQVLTVQLLEHGAAQCIQITATNFRKCAGAFPACGQITRQ